MYWVIFVWPGLALLLQRLEPRDHHGQQLQDDARGDVGHDAQREDGQVQQRAAGEQVDQRVETLLVPLGGLLEAEVHLLHVDVRRRDDRAQPEDGQDRRG